MLRHAKSNSFENIVYRKLKSLSSHAACNNIETNDGIWVFGKKNYSRFLWNRQLFKKPNYIKQFEKICRRSNGNELIY